MKETSQTVCRLPAHSYAQPLWRGNPPCPRERLRLRSDFQAIVDPTYARLELNQQACHPAILVAGDLPGQNCGAAFHPDIDVLKPRVPVFGGETNADRRSDRPGRQRSDVDSRAQPGPHGPGLLTLAPELAAKGAHAAEASEASKPAHAAEAAKTSHASCRTGCSGRTRGVANSAFQRSPLALHPIGKNLVSRRHSIAIAGGPATGFTAHSIAGSTARTVASRAASAASTGFASILIPARNLGLLGGSRRGCGECQGETAEGGEDEQASQRSGHILETFGEPSVTFGLLTGYDQQSRFHCRHASHMPLIQPNRNRRSADSDVSGIEPPLLFIGLAMPRKNLGLLFLIALGAVTLSRPVAAQRPSAPRLLPEKTLAYVRVEDTNALREGFAKSSLGRMFQDEQLRPLIGDLYSGTATLFEQISEQVGVSLDELLSIPQGEFAFAVVPLEAPEVEAETGPKDDSPEAVRERIEARRNRSPIGAILIIESRDKTPLLMRMLERLETQLQSDGFQRTERTVSETEVTTFTQARGLPIAFAEREGTVVIGIGPQLVDDLLARWEGTISGGTLAQNTDFGNVMSHCVGAEASRPQITFYADPYHLAERIATSVGGPAALGWSIMQSLQFDKLKGIGGSVFMGGDEGFESITHFHLLLDTPRDGLLAVIRPKEGPIQPEDWVPADLVSYTTLHWDVLKTYEGIDRIVSRFQGDDAMARLVEAPLKERTGVDLKADVLEQLTGRIGVIRWNEPPVRINSQTQSWAFQVKDMATFQQTLEKLSAGFGNVMEKDQFGGTTIYVRPRDSQPARRKGIRRPAPTLAIFDDYILFSDSRKAIEHLIQTRGGGASRLSQSPEYDLIAAEVSGKLDSQTPFLFSYLRSEEIFRQIYDLAKEPRSREFLKRVGEGVPAAKMLVEALERNELPAFSAFSKYFAPSGAFAYDDPTGLHYAAFTLKPIEP